MFNRLFAAAKVFCLFSKAKQRRSRVKIVLMRSIYRGCTCYLLDNIQPTSDPVFYCCFFDTQISLEISGDNDDDSRGGAFSKSLRPPVLQLADPDCYIHTDLSLTTYVTSNVDDDENQLHEIIVTMIIMTMMIMALTKRIDL